jgi:hypothetical protein
MSTKETLYEYKIIEATKIMPVPNFFMCPGIRGTDKKVGDLGYF